MSLENIKEIPDFTNNKNADEIMRLMKLGAEGALPRGTRVKNISTDKDDEEYLELGDEGVIIGSLLLTEKLKENEMLQKNTIGEDVVFLYLIKWDVLNYENLYCISADKFIEAI